MGRSWRPASNKDLFKGVAFILLLVIISHFKQPVGKELVKKTEPLKQMIPVQPPTPGVMVTVREGKAVPLLHQGFRNDRLVRRMYAKQTVGIMAQASDRNIYYANGFLQGFVPFEVDSVYTAMNFISMRLRYAYDERLFGGIKDLWQTSKEAYNRMRGDCEDHAILLSDWLNTLGYDTRVAVGLYKGEGHAWVVWFDHGSPKIIEATSKRQKRRYPLAMVLPDYKAYYMFDAKRFWVKLRHTFVEDYRMGWQETARFKAQQQKG